MHRESALLNDRDQYVRSAGGGYIASLMEQRRMSEMSQAMTGDTETRMTVSAEDSHRGVEIIFRGLYDRLTRFLDECWESLGRGESLASDNDRIIAGTMPGLRPAWAR